MGILSNAVGQVIAGMSPAERSETIYQVATQALAQMSDNERGALAQRLLTLLVDGLNVAERQSLATAMSRRLTAELD